LDSPLTTIAKRRLNKEKELSNTNKSELNTIEQVKDKNNFSEINEKNDIQNDIKEENETNEQEKGNKSDIVNQTDEDTFEDTKNDTKDITVKKFIEPLYPLLDDNNVLDISDSDDDKKIELPTLSNYALLFNCLISWVTEESVNYINNKTEMIKIKKG